MLFSSQEAESGSPPDPATPHYAPHCPLEGELARLAADLTAAQDNTDRVTAVLHDLITASSHRPVVLQHFQVTSRHVSYSVNSKLRENRSIYIL